MRRRTALICTTVAALLAPASASAQLGTPVEGISVTGVGRVQVREPARQTEASVQRAVDVAQRAALPRALADASRKATELSRLSGVPLGGIFSVVETNFGGDFGSFGPDGYCRETPARPARGSRPAQRARTTCRVPETATTTVFVTYRRG